jgi:prepilin-type N-terminal cleavage/methylation domain-containing protein
MNMHMPQNQRRFGFTLVEIMVALTVGGIAIGSLYAVGSASTRHFRDQQRVAAAQTSLRAAMDQLKHDFQRAGFMSTPNSTLAGEACFPPQNLNGQQNDRLAAVYWYLKGVAAPTNMDPASLNTADPYFTVDDVILSGNFATSGEYPNISVDTDGVTVTVPMAWQSFRRDFTEWNGTTTAGDCNAVAFDQAFPVGRLVRLHAMNGGMFYSRVSRTACTGNGRVGSPDNAVIILKDAVPPTCNMTGGWIAPVNTMRYWVSNADANADSNDTRMTVLRRTEMLPNDHINMLTAAGTTVPIEDRAILDYVVRFTADFIMRDVNTRVMNYSLRSQNDVVNNPEYIRGVVLEVAVRTAQAEPDFTNNVPGAMFRLNTQLGSGAARVRRARAELLLPNIAARGL